jgi:hypothetical protein
LKTKCYSHLLIEDLVVFVKKQTKIVRKIKKKQIVAYVIVHLKEKETMQHLTKKECVAMVVMIDL